jgi:hypothetical protein
MSYDVVDAKSACEKAKVKYWRIGLTFSEFLHEPEGKWTMKYLPQTWGDNKMSLKSEERKWSSTKHFRKIKEDKEYLLSISYNNKKLLKPWKSWSNRIAGWDTSLQDAEERGSRGSEWKGKISGD